MVPDGMSACSVDVQVLIRPEIVSGALGEGWVTHVDDRSRVDHDVPFSLSLLLLRSSAQLEDPCSLSAGAFGALRASDAEVLSVWLSMAGCAHHH